MTLGRVVSLNNTYNDTLGTPECKLNPDPSTDTRVPHAKGQGDSSIPMGGGFYDDTNSPSPKSSMATPSAAEEKKQAALWRARKKFDVLDTNGNGSLDSEELLELVDWVWDSFHPNGTKYVLSCVDCLLSCNRCGNHG